MKRFAALAVSAFLASGARAAPTTFIIDNAHTYPHFSYSHFGFSTQTHKFDKIGGRIVLDRAAKTGAVDVSIDATSVNTGFALFNQHLNGPDFFDTAKYPTITFKSDTMKFKGDQPASVTGNLTIKGITRPVTLTITHFQCMPHPMLKVEACGANATATVKRSEFNMGKYAPNVSDEVTLSLPIEAIKDQPKLE